MSTYYYFICKETKQRQCIGSTSRGGSMNISEDIGAFVKAHLGKQLEIAIDGDWDLCEYGDFEEG